MDQLIPRKSTKQTKNLKVGRPWGSDCPDSESFRNQPRHLCGRPRR